MKRLSILSIAVLMCMLFAGSAMAFDWPSKGDLFGGNELDIYQDGGLNSVDILQEDCFDCDGPFKPRDELVPQNKADIDQYGVGNKVVLDQTNTFNRAIIYQKGLANEVKAIQR